MVNIRVEAETKDFSRVKVWKGDTCIGTLIGQAYDPESETYRSFLLKLPNIRFKTDQYSHHKPENGTTVRITGMPLELGCLMLLFAELSKENSDKITLDIGYKSDRYTAKIA